MVLRKPECNRWAQTMIMQALILISLDFHRRCLISYWMSMLRMKGWGWLKMIVWRNYETIEDDIRFSVFFPMFIFRFCFMHLGMEIQYRKGTLMAFDCFIVSCVLYLHLSCILYAWLWDNHAGQGRMWWSSEIRTVILGFMYRDSGWTATIWVCLLEFVIRYASLGLDDPIWVHDEPPLGWIPKIRIMYYIFA